MSKDQVMAATELLIQRYGWAATGVFDPDGVEPPYTYTTGLFQTYMHCELAIAMPNRQGHEVLVSAVRLIEGGQRFAAGDSSERVLRDYTVRFADPMPNRMIFGVTVARYGPGVPTLQILWPDSSGRFPGDKLADATLAERQLRDE